MKFPSHSPLTKFDLKWLPVFRIVNQVWCELQVELDLTHQRTAESEVVGQGIVIHDELHSQLFSQMQVTPLTPEDIFFVYLWSILVKTQSLLTRKISREVLVFGFLEDVPIMGCIDEVYLEGQEILIRETKTRRSTRVPTPAQKLQGKLQLHVYRSLLTQMREEHETLFKLLTLSGAHLDVPLSSSFVTQFNAESPSTITKFSHKSLIKGVIKSAGDLPPVATTMELRYIAQKTGNEIVSYDIAFNETFLQRKLRWALEYWLGHRTASSVDYDKTWKCKYCVYRTMCPFLKELG